MIVEVIFQLAVTVSSVPVSGRYVMWQAVDTLLDTSEGDMRKAITTLQSAARLKGKDGVTKADIVEVAGVRASHMYCCFCSDPFCVDAVQNIM